MKRQLSYWTYRHAVTAFCSEHSRRTSTQQKILPGLHQVGAPGLVVVQVLLELVVDRSGIVLMWGKKQKNKPSHLRPVDVRGIRVQTTNSKTTTESESGRMNQEPPRLLTMMTMMLQVTEAWCGPSPEGERANERTNKPDRDSLSYSTHVETSVLICWCVSHLGVPEEKCLLQEGVDVSQRGVVHEETQAGLEVTGNDCRGEKIR